MNDMEDLLDFDEELTVPAMASLPLELLEDFDDDSLAGLFQERLRCLPPPKLLRRP